MATIEHMYSMLQKMEKNNNSSSNVSTNISSNVSTNISSNVSTNNDSSNNNQLMEILSMMDSMKIEHLRSLEIINTLTIKICELEKEMEFIKGNTNNNSKYLCQQIRGQQLLTSYPEFFSSSQDTRNNHTLIEEEHIKLKIEETPLVEMNTQEISPVILEDSEEENVSEEEVGTEDEVEDQEEVEEVVEEEEEVEEEVEEEEEQEEVVEEQVVEEQEVVEEEDQDEEEVFEIEIDDVTYFATHEENGILYEITTDGEVGKKVGIIKDGEPIFN
jgi:hypothetical protein